MPAYDRDVRDILRKYGGRIERQISTSGIEDVNYSKAYVKFKQEMAPETSRYERLCSSVGSIIRLKASEKDRLKIQKQLDIAHLDLEPWQPLTLSIIALLSVFFLGLLISVAIAVIVTGE